MRLLDSIPSATSPALALEHSKKLGESLACSQYYCIDIWSHTLVRFYGDNRPCAKRDCENKTFESHLDVLIWHEDTPTTMTIVFRGRQITWVVFFSIRIDFRGTSYQNAYHIQDDTTILDPDSWLFASRMDFSSRCTCILWSLGSAFIYSSNLLDTPQRRLVGQNHSSSYHFSHHAWRSTRMTLQESLPYLIATSFSDKICYGVIGHA